MKIVKDELENGLKVVVIPKKDRRTICNSLFVKAGSRFEKDEQAGISHFLEHLVFKSTENYQNSRQISQEIEGLGGKLNAGTDTDLTLYYNELPFRHQEIGLNILKEIVFKPKLRGVDIESEKPVIKEEIKMYQDMPASYVGQVLKELMGESHALARPIIGYEKTVEGFSKERIKKYYQSHYKPSNMVMVVAGGMKDPSKVFDRIVDKFSLKGETVKIDETEFSPTQKNPRMKVKKQKTKQSHLALGFYISGYNNPERFKQDLLSSVLGGGMSSRLFDELREKRGLCYHVSSHVDRVSEIGRLGFYAGVELNKTEQALKILLKELEKVKNIEVKEKELAKAKEHLKGGLDFERDDNFQTCYFYGVQELLKNKRVSYDEIKQKIDAVTPKELKKEAKSVFQPSKANLALIGPYGDKRKEKLRKILNNFK